MKQLKITLGGREFLADVCEREAPQAVAAMTAAGRFDSIVFSAKVCSNEITWATPCGDLDVLENPVLEEEPGNVVFYPPWSAICVFFGPTEPAGWCAKFAQISQEHLAGFIEEASKVWENQGGIVTTEMVEVEA